MYGPCTAKEGVRETVCKGCLEREKPRHNGRGFSQLLPVPRSWERAVRLRGTAHGDIARQPFAHLTDADNTEPAGLIRWQPLYHHALA